VGLPVRNGGARVAQVVQSVLAQDHSDLELVICDNASTDDTEEICRGLAGQDSRIVYRRHSQNIGIVGNFMFALHTARGEYFRWIGDDDRLEASYVSKTLAEIESDPQRILVTTQIAYQDPYGAIKVADGYDAGPMSSGDPLERLHAFLKLLNQSYLLVDPLYGLLVRRRVTVIPRRNMLREDQVFATKLALAGPWGHVPEVLAHRHTKTETRQSVAKLLDAPRWQARFANILQFSEIVRSVDQFDLTPAQRRTARGLVRRAFVQRQATIARHRARRVLSLVSPGGRGAGAADPASA
jgi:glycosyltransferase involved in cell wall biosynthesis